MKRTAEENIRKFYVDKGYRNIDVQTTERRDTSISNSVLLTFIVDKKNKVKVNEIVFGGNENVSDSKLKKQMKGTKEMSRFTLNPAKLTNPYAPEKSGNLTFKNYLNQNGYLIHLKQKSCWIRISVLSWLRQNSMIKNMKKIKKKYSTTITLWAIGMR